MSQFSLHCPTTCQHDELPDSSQYIRLLEILPRQGRCYENATLTDIHFKMTVVNTSQMPEYEALSYTWGQGFANQAIYLNDELFCVKNNLFAFLQDYRRRALDKAPKLLWVDAICIDQTNEHEKGHGSRIWVVSINKLN